MAGVLFIVTIPTQQEERSQSTEVQSNPEICSKNEKIKQKCDTFENGVFKISSPESLLLETDDYEECAGLLNIAQGSSMEIIMNELFKKLKIDNAVWQLSKNMRYYQITFFVESNARHELILSTLNEWGIGQRNKSALSMIPCAIYNQSSSKSDELDPRTELIVEQKQTTWDTFVKSAHARYNVAKIVERVRRDATITFDFITLTIVAGMLASFGLIENSTTTLTSSMLISPLMGPVLATLFGIVIKDRALIRFGLINEVIGILLATVIGFSFGLIICSLDSEYAYGSKRALTTEMISRCELHSVLIGIFTASFTGAAAAIGVLGENIASLVGVAISVSLLPPAVNAGVFWALAVLYKLNENDESLYGKVVTTNYYSNHQSIELTVYGAISMLLTIVNVLCILFVGVIILKIKEVAPLTKIQSQLWKHDIKVARDYNRKSSVNDDEMVRQLVKEQKTNEETMQSIYRESYQNTWSPMSSLLPDFDPIGIHTSLHSPSVFDKSNHFTNNNFFHKKRRNTLHTYSPQRTSHISNLKVLNRFQLAKIPEIVISSSSLNLEQNSNNENDPGPSTSTKQFHKFIVTKTDVSDIEKQ